MAVACKWGIRSWIMLRDEVVYWGSSSWTETSRTAVKPVRGYKLRRMKHEFTSVIEKRSKWYVAYVEEMPGVNTQGRTLAAARRNLKEALTQVLEANRALSEKDRSPDAKPEPITVTV
ncbi:MAG TPA: type II toxin-antitoxin system HicB family antitoxin [Candidatus Acidoferrum sp.]